MKLYGSDTSPYVRKARILVKEKRIPCEWIAEKPADPGGRFRELNPLGKIPVLELDNGDALFDSPVILEYLDSLPGHGDALLPPVSDARWTVQKVHALADGIVDAVVARYLELRRPAVLQSSDEVEKQQQKILRGIAYAESLVDKKIYIVENRYTLADLALGVALQYVDFRFNTEWRSHAPRLAYWLAGIGTRPAFPETEPPGMGRIPDSPH